MATIKRKKKVGSKRGGSRPGAGRPRGARSVLPQGVARPLKLLSGMPQEVLDHPKIQEALGVIEGVMNGTVQHRHVQTRLQAATLIIEFYAGKPKARQEIDVGPSLADMLKAAEQRPTKEESESSE